MRSIDKQFKQMVSQVPENIKEETDLSFAIADKLNALMKDKGLTKREFAEALGKRPSEITKWLSGQHNFTIRTLSTLSSFFGKSLIEIAN